MPKVKQPETKASKKLEKSSKKVETKPEKKAKSKSQKAGLVLPVPRVSSRLKKLASEQRVASLSSVSLSAAIELVSREIFDGAVSQCNALKKKRANPANVANAVSRDADLCKLLPTQAHAKKVTNVSAVVSY